MPDGVPGIQRPGAPQRWQLPEGMTLYHPAAVGSPPLGILLSTEMNATTKLKGSIMMLTV